MFYRHDTRVATSIIMQISMTPLIELLKTVKIPMTPPVIPKVKNIIVKTPFYAVIWCFKPLFSFAFHALQIP